MQPETELFVELLLSYRTGQTAVTRSKWIAANGKAQALVPYPC